MYFHRRMLHATKLESSWELTLLSYCTLSPCYWRVAQCCRAEWLYSGLFAVSDISVTASCWSAAHVQRASSRLLEGVQQSSNTCHSQKIVLHSSRVSEQPRGLKQYHKSNDFIYSFNTKMSSSSQFHPWGL